MQPADRYYDRAKISEAEFRCVLRLFALDLTASDPACLTGLSGRAVNDLHLRLRRRLQAWNPGLVGLDGAVERDEGCFGPQRVRSKRDRGVSVRTSAFGLFKHSGQVHTEIVPEYSRKTLQTIIRGRIDVAALVNTDGWHGYDELVAVGFDRRFRVRHDQARFVPNASHSNGIESF